MTRGDACAPQASALSASATAAPAFRPHLCAQFWTPKSQSTVVRGAYPSRVWCPASPPGTKRMPTRTTLSPTLSTPLLQRHRSGRGYVVRRGRSGSCRTRIRRGECSPSQRFERQRDRSPSVSNRICAHNFGRPSLNRGQPPDSRRTASTTLTRQTTKLRMASCPWSD
jgi:hypothetical protein